MILKKKKHAYKRIKVVSSIIWWSDANACQHLLASEHWDHPPLSLFPFSPLVMEMAVKANLLLKSHEQVSWWHMGGGHSWVSQAFLTKHHRSFSR